MRIIVATILLSIGSVLAVQAQSNKTQGSVTVTQSDDIDALVNGKKTTPHAATPHKQESTHKAETTPHAATEHRAATEHKTRKSSEPVGEYSVNENGEPVRIVRRLVRHGKKKVNGYRVQVYSGGNTRVARQEAEAAGQKVKSILPDEPVYVHFYTPRWLCRVGNFTSYNQALSVLRKVRKLGYRQAIVIKCKVTVDYTEVID